MPWLSWILLCVALAVVGLAVLGVLAFRVFAAVRELGREVERTRQRLEPKLVALDEAAARLERQ